MIKHKKGTTHNHSCMNTLTTRFVSPRIACFSMRLNDIYSKRFVVFDFHRFTKETMGKLDGKIALITGGSEGIGLATAQLFVAEGAYVYITGRRQDILDEAVKKIGGSVTAVQSDSSNISDIKKLIAKIRDEKARLDILCANAAFFNLVHLSAVDEQHFDTTFNTNVKGVLFLVQESLPIFSDHGSIILTGSSCSTKGLPSYSLYSASKAAIRSFARCWSVDLKERKIRVNVISPGDIDTAMLQKDLSLQGDIEQNESARCAQFVINRIGKPEEIAKAVLFLASNDDSSYITGIDLYVDGGWAQI